MCVYCVPLVVCLQKTIDLISSEANRKIAHVACEIQYDLIRDFYAIKVHDLEGSFSAVPGSHTRNCGGNSLWILRIAGTTDETR